MSWCRFSDIIAAAAAPEPWSQDASPASAVRARGPGVRKTVKTSSRIGMWARTRSGAAAWWHCTCGDVGHRKVPPRAEVCVSAGHHEQRIEEEILELSGNDT